MNMPEKKPKQNIMDDPNREYAVGLIKAIGGIEKSLSSLEKSPTVAIMKALQEKLENGSDVASFMWSLLRGPRGEKGDSIKGDPGEQGIPGKQGIPGEPGKSLDEGEILRKLLKSIPEPIPGKKGDPGEKGEDAVVDYAKIIDTVIEKLPKNKDAKKELLKISVKDIADFPEIGELVRKYVYDFSESRAGATIVAPGASSLLTLADVNPKDLAVGFVPTWNGKQFVFQARDSGMAGGSDTQVQFNDGGSFGGISGATTDGTAVTFATNGLLANTLKSATSAGTLFESNSGTDVLLLGAGGGAGATFYGGVNVGGTLTVLGQGGTGGMVAGDASIGAGYTGISLSGTLTSSNYNFGGGTGDVNLYINRPTGGKIFFRENNAAARVTFSASGLNGFETTSPTHTLTLGSTGTGIALYNTADQTTNYERGQIFWNSNAFTISSTKAGSGTDRSLILSAGASNQSTITLTRASLPVINLNSGVTSLTGNLSSFTLAGNATSGTQVFTAFTPTLTQTGTAGYTALLVNPTETTTGSGTKLLADFQVGGSSKAVITNTGSLGIGTTAPSIPLDVISTSSGGRAQGIGLRNASTADNTEIALKFSNTTVTTVTDASGTGEISVIRVNAPNAGDTNMAFKTTTSGGLITRMTLNASGLGIGVAPTASLTLKAGTATANTAPLQFTAGVVETTPRAGLVEFVNAEDGLTFTAVSTRRKFVLDTATQTLTGKRITNRVQTVASSATVTPSWDNDDVVTITAQAVGLTLANPTGTPTAFQPIKIRVKDNGTARAIAYGAGYRAIGVTLPTTTVISKTLYLGGFWNEADSKLDITSVAQEA